VVKVAKSSSKGAQYKNFLSKPAASYFMILVSVSSLSGLGLVMVLSASSVTSLELSGNAYSIFLKQLLFLIMGVGLATWGALISTSKWLGMARLSLIAGGVALTLPILFGKTIGGNKNWIGFGSFLIQPSEFAKMALILYCALMLRRHEERLEAGRKSQAWIHLAPGAGLFILLIMAGKDLGTAMIVAGIVVALLFISGIDMKSIIIVAGTLLIGATGLAINQPSRMRRFRAVIDPFAPAVYKFAGWQPAHSLMSLASGGIFGVGIGASKQKWANLSEAHTDFIFSVIGEEMGLIGTVAVISLYTVLIFAIFRVAIHTKDSFSKYAVTGIGSWLILQVLVNLLTDVGLVPVIGVTLPFISYGGSSLISNFLGIAFVLNVARQEPELKALIRERKAARS
jgi:cell division protein FtsW